MTSASRVFLPLSISPVSLHDFYVGMMCAYVMSIVCQRMTYKKKEKYDNDIRFRKQQCPSRIYKSKKDHLDYFPMRGNEVRRGKYVGGQLGGKK